MASSEKINLTPQTTKFHLGDRGLMCTVTVAHGDNDAGNGRTVRRFYIPKVSRTKVTVLGAITIVYIGSGLVLSMPNAMWKDHEDGVLTAALGQQWDGGS